MTAKKLGFIFLILAVQFNLLLIFLFPALIVMGFFQQLGNYFLR